MQLATIADDWNCWFLNSEIGWALLLCKQLACAARKVAYDTSTEHAKAAQHLKAVTVLIPARDPRGPRRLMDVRRSDQIRHVFRSENHDANSGHAKN